MGTVEDTTDALIGALRHPRRRQIVALLWGSERPLSPSEIGDVLDEAVPNTSYNIRVVLQGAGLVPLAGIEPTRGSIEHFYELTELARASDVVRMTVEATASLCACPSREHPRPRRRSIASPTPCSQTRNGGSSKLGGAGMVARD